MAEKITVNDDEARKKYFRGYPEADEIDTQASGEALNEVTLYDLVSAFRKVLTDIQRQAVYHTVEKVSYPVEDQAEFALYRLQVIGGLPLNAFLREHRSRETVVVPCVAGLDVSREQQMRL